jgi:hypothetical protein
LIDHKNLAPLGLIVYPGKELIEIRNNIWAVPDWLILGCDWLQTVRRTDNQTERQAEDRVKDE